jgi:hypothetical protein
MSEDLKFPVPEDFKKSAHITDEIHCIDPYKSHP